MKIIFNTCYGGFGFSTEALKLYKERGGKHPLDLSNRYETGWRISRTDPIMIEVIMALGKKANAECASLAIAEVPDGSYYNIDEYDGAESVTYTLTPPPEVFSGDTIYYTEGGD